MVGVLQVLEITWETDISGTTGDQVVVEGFPFRWVFQLVGDQWSVDAFDHDLGQETVEICKDHAVVWNYFVQVLE